MYAAERRDFILIQHTEEEVLANELVPGVILFYFTYAIFSKYKM